MNDFTFNPVNGLLDTTVYPSEPASETIARQQFMDLFNQIKNYINSTTNISGNAGTATKLQTPRTFTLAGDASGSASFDGSANPTITVTVADDSHAHTNISGNAGTATKLATVRTISLTGDASGTANFDGSANASITVVIADDSHNHIISNVDGLQTALDGKVDNTDFTQNFVQNGWTKLPNGLIIQWGSITVTTSGMAWTYPIAFPNAVLNVQVNVNQNLPTATIAAVTPITTNVNFISNVQVNAMAMVIGY